MALLVPGRVELLTGVNLPMILKFFAYRERYPLPELVEFLKSHACEGIVLGSEMLRRQT
jgi:PTS system mannose-specific IIA component